MTFLNLHSLLPVGEIKPDSTPILQGLMYLKISHEQPSLSNQTAELLSQKAHECESYFRRGGTAHTDKIIFSHKHMQYQGHKLHIYPEGKKKSIQKKKP